MPKSIRRTSIAVSLLTCALIASALVLADPASQAIVDTRIFRIEAPVSEGAPYTVLSTADGYVYTVNPANQELVLTIQALAAGGAGSPPVHLQVVSGEIVAVTPMTDAEAAAYVDPVLGDGVGEGATPDEVIADINAELDGGTEVPAPSPKPVLEPYPIREFRAKQGYEPTILNSYEEAKRLYDEAKDLDHDSQCHERAMVWSHTWFKTRKIRSMKVMMFYTQRFRTEYQHKKSGILGDSYEIYKWWYHTAPMVYVRENGKLMAYVIDKEFLDRPAKLEDWSYHFLVTEISGQDRNRYIPYSNVSDRVLTPQEATCQLMKNFRDYAVPRLRDELTPFWCQMRIYPMYYMQPADIATLDCDPKIDANYTCGLTGGCRRFGRGPLHNRVLDERLDDGRPKWGCRHEILRDFRKGDLKVAYKRASER